MIPAFLWWLGLKGWPCFITPYDVEELGHDGSHDDDRGLALCLQAPGKGHPDGGFRYPGFDGMPFGSGESDSPQCGDTTACPGRTVMELDVGHCGLEIEGWMFGNQFPETVLLNNKNGWVWFRHGFGGGGIA